MLEIIESSVVYQANTKLVELAYAVAQERNYKKPSVQVKVQEGFRIYKLLQALQYEAYLTLTQRQKIVYCLIDEAGINDFPVAPVLGSITPPTISVGIPGPPGIQGQRGEDGGATDFSLINSGTDSVVDSFPPTDALAARWDYVVYDGSGNQRAGSVIASWTSDGLSITSPAEYTTTDLGDTSPIQFTVDFFGGVIRLNAVITSGFWTVKGSRYFMPNNGSGTGPINTSLQDGYIFVGNASNIATAVLPSGDITVSNTGVFSIPAGTIVNADINASAGIVFNKMAALTASKITVTDGSGFITTSSAATLTELSYLSGVTSNIQTQLDSKVGSITGAISTVVSVDLTPSRAIVSNPSGKIAISGVTTTELSVLSGITSSTTELNYSTGVTASLNDSLISYTTSGVTYQNTAVAGANFGIKKTSRNTVKIAGILTLRASGGYSNLTTYTTLPVGYRPSYQIYKSVIITQVGGSAIRTAVVINTNGTIQFDGNADAQSGFVCSAHFDGLEFDL